MATKKNKPDASTMNLEAMLSDMLPGATVRSSDAIGFWDSENGGPIVIIPRHAAAFDSKKFDPTKPSVLIFAELVKDATVLTSDGEVVSGKAGELIGIFAKPGMRQIRNMCGVTTFLARDSRKDINTGKGNDMKGYMVASQETGSVIPITDDRRDKSRGSKTFLD